MRKTPQTVVKEQSAYIESMLTEKGIHLDFCERVKVMVAVKNAVRDALAFVGSKEFV